MITGNEPVYAKSAFYHPDGGVDPPQQGLTIRQHFAAMAMQGFCANPEVLKVMTAKLTPEQSGSYLALASVEQADLLIEELNKNPG